VSKRSEPRGRARASVLGDDLVREEVQALEKLGKHVLVVQRPLDAVKVLELVHAGADQRADANRARRAGRAEPTAVAAAALGLRGSRPPANNSLPAPTVSDWP